MGIDGSVHIEVLARKDCDNRGMAVAIVERVVEETGVPAEIAQVDVTSIAQAKKLGFTGSPTVRVDGRDVDRHPGAVAVVSLGDRVYRTERGLAGWPDAEWVREEVLLAVASSTSNGRHDPSAASSSTSP